MQTSRFQLGLIATLAVGLGFSLSSSEAIGYPAGAAISMGSNPLWAKGGEVDASSVTVISAPADRDVVVTDVLLTYRNANCHPTVSIRTGAGELLAKFFMYQDQDSDKTMQPTTIMHSFSSGLPVAAGGALELQEHDDCNVAYTLSGYYAQP
jgi:hypothetical protein